MKVIVSRKAEKKQRKRSGIARWATGTLSLFNNISQTVGAFRIHQTPSRGGYPGIVTLIYGVVSDKVRVMRETIKLRVVNLVLMTPTDPPVNVCAMPRGVLKTLLGVAQAYRLPTP